MVADGNLRGNIKLKAAVLSLYASASCKHRSPVVCTYLNIYDSQKNNYAISGQMYGYIICLDGLFADDWRWLSASQPLKRGKALWRIADELWAVVREYIAWDTVQEYPIVEKCLRKRRRWDFLSGNCMGEFWKTVGHNAHVLITWRFSW